MMLLIFLLLEHFVCRFKAMIYTVMPSMLQVETNACRLEKTFILTLNLSSLHVTRHSDGHAALPERTEPIRPNAEQPTMLLQILAI